MRFYFTRHGESEANLLRIISNRDLSHPLTDTGRQQALALAGQLRGRPVTRIYCSPILRARQTGEILARELSIPHELSEALREPDCGILEGRRDEEAWAAHHYWFQTWLSDDKLDQGPEGGETCKQVRSRFMCFVQSLAVENEGKLDEIVLVSHGETLLFGLTALVPGLSAETLFRRGLGHAELIQVDYLNGMFVYSG